MNGLFSRLKERIVLRVERYRHLIKAPIFLAAVLALVVTAVGLTALQSGSDSSQRASAPPSGEETEQPSEVDSSPSPTATLSPESPQSTPRSSPTPSPSPSPSPTPPPVCTPEEVEVVTTTDRSSYQPGEEVKVTSTITNRSNHVCYRPGTTDGMEIAFWDSEGTNGLITGYIPDYVGPLEWAAGEAITYSYSWDQKTCMKGSGCSPYTQAPPGTYFVEVTWRQYEWKEVDGEQKRYDRSYKASATFEIVGSS